MLSYYYTQAIKLDRERLGDGILANKFNGCEKLRISAVGAASCELLRTIIVVERPEEGNQAFREYHELMKTWNIFSVHTGGMHESL